MARNRSSVQSEQKTKSKVAKPQQGTGIRCPKCGGKTHVTRTLPMPDESKHGRYRRCDSCKWRIYTEERIVIEDVQTLFDEQKKERVAQMRAARTRNRK